MFRNQSGNLRADAEEIAERVKSLPDKDIQALEERKMILRDALHSFDARLRALPARERGATLSLLYQRFTDTLFDFHLSVETSSARAKITEATTKGEKSAALEEFQAVIGDLSMLYNVQ